MTVKSSDQMLEGKGCQIILVGTTHAPNDRVVIAGIDGSKNSWNALGWACAEATRTASSVVAVLVTPERSLDTELEELDPDASNDAPIQDRVDGVEALRSKAQQFALKLGVRLRFTHVCGDTVNELLRITDSHQANLIVVGKPTVGIHGIAGSLGRRLITDRDVPVIVVEH